VKTKETYPRRRPATSGSSVLRSTEVLNEDPGQASSLLCSKWGKVADDPLNLCRQASAAVIPRRLGWASYFAVCKTLGHDIRCMCR
jgi:hypothetical protein